MAYVENDSFCKQTDIEARLQRGTFTVSTKPTAQQVLDAMARRAAQVESALARAGQPYTVPSGANPFDATPTGLERRLKVMAEEANIVGACADALQMWISPQQGTSSEEQVVAYLRMYQASLEGLEKQARELGSAVTTTSATTATTRDADREDLFDLDTKW